MFYTNMCSPASLVRNRHTMRSQKECDNVVVMKVHKITAGGQVSLPAEVRHRWDTTAVVLEDLGDRVVVRPLPADPIGAARGALKGRLTSDSLRAAAREDDSAAAARR